MTGDEFNSKIVSQLGWTLWHYSAEDAAAGSVFKSTIQFGREPGPPIRIIRKALLEDWQKWITAVGALTPIKPRPWREVANNTYVVEAAD